MGHQIIKQPDGKLAVFSSSTDSWIIVNATQAELEDYYAERAAEDARSSTRKIVEHVLAGHPTRVYYQFAMTVEEADELAAENGHHRLAELTKPVTGG